MMVKTPPPNCATGTIAPYIPSAQQPWTYLQAQHLYRRLGYSADNPTIIASLELEPSDLVDQLIDDMASAPNLPEPSWSEWILDDYSDFGTEAVDQVFEYTKLWVRAMLEQSGKEKLTLFWHNHFVTRFEDYFCPSWLYTYHQILQTYALGNFRDFVYEIGKTPAMLVYLNGVQNTRFEPNENYARELFELFTLGQDNGYTQADIVDAARALTGWNGFSVTCAPITYVPLLHDTEPKTIFGLTGNWDYDDLHEILFTERAQQMANHICGKIYRHYVHPEGNDDITAELAQTLIDNNWELEPVFRQLFKSEHFFDEYIIGTQIKSPIDLINTTIKESNFPINSNIEDLIILGSYQLNQGLFNPVDVAGWPGDRDWVNTSSVSGRWQLSDYVIFTALEVTPELLVGFAQSLTSDNANDPELITQAIVDFMIPRGLGTPEAYAAATSVLKWEVPQNYYDNGDWNLFWETAPAQVALLMRHISRLPEFHLS